MFEQLKDVVSPPLLGTKIAFLHLPKCGGTSITKAISDLYKPWRPNRFRKVVLLDEMAARDADMLTGVTYHDVRKVLLAYHLSIPEVDFIAGHFAFSRTAFERHKQKWHFITVLRDPINRWLSHYYYNSQDDEKNSRFYIHSDIETFLETREARRMGALVVSQFTEDSEQRLVRSAWSIRTTIETLREFTLVGSLEGLERFSDDFRRMFNHSIKIPHRNVGKDHKNRQRIEQSSELMRIIESYCAPDIAVYNALFPTRR